MEQFRVLEKTPYMHDRLSGCHEMQGIVSKCQQHFFQILVSCKHLHKDQRVAFAGLVIIHLSRAGGAFATRILCAPPEFGTWIEAFPIGSDYHWGLAVWAIWPRRCDWML